MKNKLLLIAMGLIVSTQALLAQVPSYVPTNGLVGYWPFNGNANDESGNGNDGTVNGATLTTDRNGIGNKAYNFDGINNHIVVSNPVNLPLENSNRTFSCWFNYQTSIQQPIYNDWSSLICYGDFSSDCNANYLLLNNNETVLFSSPGTCVGLTSSTSNIINSWHLVTMTYTNGTISIYIDSELISQNVMQGNMNTTISSLFFGMFNNQILSSQKYNLHGDMDDIGIWNRVLTQQEITAMYNQVPTYSDTCNNVSGSLTQGLVGYWPFCGNANDDSGHGNNGTVNGATLTTDRFGNSNSAYSFNGANNYIEIGNSPQIDTMDDFTISTWYTTNTISPQFQHLVSKDFMGAPPTGDWDLFLNYNKVKFDITLNANNYFGLSNASIPLNTWNNIVITRNSSSGIVNTYINGVLDNTFTGYIGTYSNIQRLNFGRQGSSNQHFLNGKLDDIGIWNRALSPSEVTQLFNQNQCFTNTTVTDTLVINVGQLSYTNPVAYANNITIFPNPTSTQVNISFNNITDLTGGNINIINSLGQQVATTPITLSGTSTTISLDTWGGSGLYFVQILNAQGIVVDVKKIILQ
jgi:hypothetical protein